jgi:hypothetical protein
MASTNHSHIVRALYEDDDVVLEAVKKVRAKGYHVKEVFSPFPIHGLDKAMGLEPTRISIAGFLYGLGGLSTASIVTYYMMIVDWNQNIGGKPSFTWGLNMPAFVPIMFELTVFFAAHLMVWTFFMKSKLYPGAEAQNDDPRVTDDKFLMEVELHGEKESLMDLLKESGAIEISEKK